MGVRLTTYYRKRSATDNADLQKLMKGELYVSLYLTHCPVLATVLLIVIPNESLPDMAVGSCRLPFA